MGPGALVASALVHCFLVACGAYLWSSRASLPAEDVLVELAVEEAHPAEPAEGRETPDGRATSDTQRLRDPEAPAIPPGGEARARPDVAARGRGGSLDGQRATNLSSRVAPLTLERNPLNHLERSELARLRTARHRRSWDDRRATPNPMELDFVASGRGRLAMRRPLAPSSPNQGAAHGAMPTLEGASPGSASGAGWEGPLGAAHAGGRATPSAGLPLAERGPLNRISAQVMTARPWLPATRAAVEAPTHERPSDTVDSRQRIASRVAALLDASALGGTAPTGVGGEPAPGAPAVGNGPSVGSRSLPSGRGAGQGDPGDDPSLGYYRSVIARLERALRDTFPRWAIAEGRGGLVVFDLTLSADGRVARVAVVRASGVVEYDRNVVRVVNGMPGFGPVPAVLGPSAVLRISYDSRNPVVGRSGPGPGHLSD